MFKIKGADRRLARGTEADTWQVVPRSGGSVSLLKNGSKVRRAGRGSFGSAARPLIAKYSSYGSSISVAGKPYDYAHGRMVFSSYTCGGPCLRLVLSLSMQKYLLGLGEVPSSWPAGVLKAQAMTGRTYAYEKQLASGRHRYPCDCTVYDSTLDQAYIGDAKRTGSGPYWEDWVRAVRGTRRRVVTYRGAPIQALYSSSSGGHTEHNENVWGGRRSRICAGSGIGPIRSRPTRTTAGARR